MPVKPELSPIPPSAYAVGVSGGADSVALLTLLLQTRPELTLHVVHLDHETRAGASAADAAFVADCCARHRLPLTLARRSDLAAPEKGWPANRSARFRAMRFALFRQACAAHCLAGVLLAHHADDQAETFVQRLLRSGAPAGLTGMSADSRVAGLRILRPLLNVRAADLRAFLRARNEPWREDQSNASPAYQRNRVRALLAAHPHLAEVCLEAVAAMRDLLAWTRSAAPTLPVVFPARQLADLPDALAEESARRWLASQGVPRGELSPAVLARLIEMSRDAATAPRQQFPGSVTVRRRGGKIDVVS
jgi:tRNA(Ile)-lysidine synthetase-like protein